MMLDNEGGIKGLKEQIETEGYRVGFLAGLKE